MEICQRLFPNHVCQGTEKISPKILSGNYVNFPKNGKISLKAENCELSPKENYLLAFHPHGVLSLSAICTFGANLDDYRDIFPGMNSYLCTLPVWFRVPFFREMLMARIINATIKINLKIICLQFRYPA